MAEFDKTAVMAFTEEQVLRLTGLSRRQVRYWRDTGFFAPSFGEGDLFYSFRDLVGLRTIAMLRKKNVPLQELRKVGAWLRDKHATPWSSLSFYLIGKTVLVEDLRTGQRVSRTGQFALTEFPMERIVSDTLKIVSADRTRKDEQLGRIEHRRGVMNHQAVVAGTRVKTSAIWDFHEAGYTDQQIRDQYPTLTLQDVRAAVAHEAERRKVG